MMEEEYEQNLKEVTSICEDIIASCPEHTYRHIAISQLCLAAKRINNTARAAEELIVRLDKYFPESAKTYSRFEKTKKSLHEFINKYSKQ